MLETNSDDSVARPALPDAGRRIVVIGGGAAGFFGAIACAEASPGSKIVLLEKGPKFLGKVLISGGGRCNVTHTPKPPREFASRYPRGERALIGLFHRFDAAAAVQWFESRGVRLKTEPDGRMFPITDSSATIAECLLNEARRLGVELRLNCAAERVMRRDGGFEISVAGGEVLRADRLLLATGGCRAASLAALATGLGHSLVSPVPSLFTFHIELPWLHALAGISVPEAVVAAPSVKARESGALLVTHWGMSGPAVLKLSARAARELHACDYRFPITVNWLPHLSEEQVRATFRERLRAHPAKAVASLPIPPLPSRLWIAFLQAAGVAEATRWSELGNAAQHRLVQQLLRAEFLVTGKSLNKDEFVTCGGIPLSEVDVRTMESKVCPGLHFAGELLDIDGLTGGFNFQAAWTTGWIAGHAMRQP